MNKVIMSLATIDSVTTTQTLWDNLQNLAYLLVPCYNFTKYISTKHDDYLDENLTSLTHQALMSMAKRKFDFLKTKGKWGAKSPDNEKIANSATVAAVATSAVNPHFAALMAAMANLDMNE